MGAANSPEPSAYEIGSMGDGSELVLDTRTWLLYRRCGSDVERVGFPEDLREDMITSADPEDAAFALGEAALCDYCAVPVSIPYWLLGRAGRAAAEQGFGGVDGADKAVRLAVEAYTRASPETRAMLNLTAATGVDQFRETGAGGEDR